MCERVPIAGGGYAIICRSSHGRRAKRCHYCTAPGTILCDAVAADQRSTCDRLCCRAHAKNVGPDKDICRDCSQSEVAMKRRLAL